MPSYKAPLREYRFLLHEAFNMSQYSELPGFRDAPLDVVDAILDEAAKLAEEVLHPLNQVGDREGCKLANGVVTTPAGFKEAYKTLVEGGWPALVADPAFGGQGLPNALGVLFNEMVSSSNMAFGMYPGLSHGAYSAILHHGADEQRATYLPKLVTGEWTGTMNLTEPHCGTDLGLLRTRAVPNGDGSYAITGTKIFISAGEHDLADNILHLVLARTEGAPAGIKGISLFIVPKFLVKEDGSLGQRNGVSCGALEHKMGIHGNATCVLNYDGARGWLVGEENKGMRAMFTMMNEARLGVGLQGLSQSEAAYQNALAYAKDRIQGRSLTGPKEADKPADPLLVHPDVRRMLLNAKAFNEGARALLVWTALHGDLSHASDDAKAREFGDDMMALLTPVVKGYLTDRGFANAVEAQQVYGGHGYIEENGLSQYVRDARIAMIYEGANGVQALDLVGRKLAQNGGRGVFGFFKLIDDFVAVNMSAETEGFMNALVAARKDLETATLWFMENALQNPDNAGAGSFDYLQLFGVTSIAFMWAMMAKTAAGKLASGGADKGFYEAKLKTARYYFERVVPETATHLARIRVGAAPLMDFAADEF